MAQINDDSATGGKSAQIISPFRRVLSQVWNVNETYHFNLTNTVPYLRAFCAIFFSMTCKKKLTSFRCDWFVTIEQICSCTRLSLICFSWIFYILTGGGNNNQKFPALWFGFGVFIANNCDTGIDWTPKWSQSWWIFDNHCGSSIVVGWVLHTYILIFISHKVNVAFQIHRFKWPLLSHFSKVDTFQK